MRSGGGLGLGLARPCHIGSPNGGASRLDGRRAATVNHERRSGTRRPLHAMWVVGSRPCAPRCRRVVAASLALGLGLRVGFLLVNLAP